MNYKIKYQVQYSDVFKRRIKKLVKKYPHIKKDLSELLDDLEQGIFKGDKLQGYPGEVYKIRLASSDQKKGKQGGFRAVYIVVTTHETVYLTEIYPKAKQEDLIEKQKQLIKAFLDKLRQY